MKTRTTPLKKQFSFAGFIFPRYLAVLPPKGLKVRLAEYNNPCGPYYHCPKPLSSDKRTHKRGAYHDDNARVFGMRWQWCDEVCRSIQHTGWFTDEYGHGEKLRGVVFRLPRGRGFLAGYSMGEGMICDVDYVYEYEADAAHAADSIAESLAQLEREYQEETDENEGE